MLFSLLGIICVIIVFAIFITRSKYFISVLDGKFILKYQIILAVLFSFLSVYGSIGRIEFMGAIVNVRDLGPMAGGLFCGPFVGIISGVTGGLYRFSLGGVSYVPCSLATVLSGILGGAVYIYCRKNCSEKYVGIFPAVVFAVLVEIFHMVLVYFLVIPGETAVEIIKAIAMPVIVANAVGMFVFSYLISNVVSERKACRERDIYQSELHRKKAELEIAAQIQKEILPKQIPTVNGFSVCAKSIPALEVGGDFYDIITLSGGRTGFVVADVSGKSVPAALFMVLSKMIMHTNAEIHTGAAGSVFEANRIICDESESGMFVTLFYAILDEDKKIEYASAGHDPAFILGLGSDVFETLPPTGPAMGLKKDAKYESGCRTISKGDILVMYTDGITDAVNSSKEFYGTERFKRAVILNRNKSPGEIVGAVTEDLKKFCGDEPRSDDITIMILKRE
ncbi:sigma-B regulation protein RsbU (phosphoserine phosphatase) [Methanomicrobium sp. W14]|uniref:SpoIIE family protein phosphatase n=1 Tax=Methanomicrobium sp. W14 TaxID=2817839 RepID=UPI001AEA64B4|nr:SpoIIE family protein phosphatase [Methanomicrobium sp. W14]MBP2132485.1 sigma-B regulation protein RsbU (phosphoserine phosphatase) [Methanomicrobium sp. W14]